MKGIITCPSCGNQHGDSANHVCAMTDTNAPKQLTIKERLEELKYSTAPSIDDLLDILIEQAGES